MHWAVSGGEAKGVCLHAVLALAGDQGEFFCSLTQCTATSSMGVVAWGCGGKPPQFWDWSFGGACLISPVLCIRLWFPAVRPDRGSIPAGQVRLQNSHRHF